MQRASSLNRDTPDYRESVQWVKVSYFTEQRGMDIRGILHVGTNDGYEVHHYKKMGIAHLAGVEPLPSAIEAFHAAHPGVPLFECALSDRPGKAMLTVVTPGSGQGSSLLVECHPHPDYDYSTQVEVEVSRGDCLPIAWDNFDCLVVDVQGMELPVLRGFGERLRGFAMLNIECSLEPVYQGEAPAAEVEAFLDGMGFARMTPLETHNDVLFVSKDRV